MRALPVLCVTAVLFVGLASGHVAHEHPVHEHDLAHGPNQQQQQQHEEHGHSQGQRISRGVIQKRQPMNERTRGGPVGLSRPRPFNVWLAALLSTVFIGIVPIVLIYFLPITMESKDDITNKNKLRFLLAFAVGGLLGDVFLHLLPHANHASEQEGTVHDEHHHHDHGSTGIWVLVGIMAFFLIEKVMRCAGSGHSHSHMDAEPALEEPLSKVTGITEGSSTLRHRGTASGKPSQMSEPLPVKDDQVVGEFTAAAYLNLVADFTHNFTDGLAIGASFLADTHIGIVTVIAILLHEIPHEIGDFAILIQAGVSRKRAMALQVWTAIGALLGTIIGLLTEGVANGTAWILPLTAGGFLYIAMATVIPELLKDSSAVQSAKEISAIAAGIGMMATVSLLE